MESLDLFLGTRAKCREKAISQLHKVAVDVLDHKSETYLILHDYHSAFLAVERIDASRNDIETEGQEITDLLTKYFLDIFDIKAKCLLSDKGNHRYTCYITNFCSANAIRYYFPKNDEMPGISRITTQAIVNLFKECDENFIEVQIALGVLRDSGSKKNKSPAQILFYEEKELILWDSEKYDNNFLEVTYAQLTLMKSKLDHRLLAITNALLKKNKNSVNFKIDYPRLLLEEPMNIEAQISIGFQNVFTKIYSMIKEDQLNHEINLLDATKIASKYGNAKIETLTDNKMEGANVLQDDIAEMWGEMKSAEMKKRGLCSLCFKEKLSNHIMDCSGHELVCFNCGCGGHNSKSCLRKPKWSRKSIEKNPWRLNLFPKPKLNRDIFLANQQELLRNGLPHVNFETLHGKEK